MHHEAHDRNLLQHLLPPSLAAMDRVLDGHLCTALQADRLVNIPLPALADFVSKDVAFGELDRPHRLLVAYHRRKIRCARRCARYVLVHPSIDECGDPRVAQARRLLRRALLSAEAGAPPPAGMLKVEQKLAPLTHERQAPSADAGRPLLGGVAASERRRQILSFWKLAQRSHITQLFDREALGGRASEIVALSRHEAQESRWREYQPSLSPCTQPLALFDAP
mmetsp:Transcript_45204/g.105575  ORF Transcript_45204/g.105575 Transcript_45204/m.105575 type:complete len:223 (+) Transcript_45204:649-1317(+)